MDNEKNGPVVSWPYGGGRFDVSDNGVSFINKNVEGHEQAKWICGPLRIAAKTRDANSTQWGRLLEWCDDDGKPHQWAMPRELLEGDGLDVRKELASRGLQISHAQGARGLLTAYIAHCPVETRALCVDRLGWHGETFVTPTGAIGDGGEHVVFQNAHALEPAFTEAGTVEAWRDAVAKPAQGNSRLVFALSVAFAAPLADIVGEDSGGFHFRGASSTGKSTALKLAASVWGHPDTYVRLWRSTVNGLEGLAAIHNDGVLILDEIGQVDPNDAGEAAYMLGNGQGKARASRNGLARPAHRWRLVFLSAGEESLSAVMMKVGKQATAGQEIRLADIEADAGAGMGMFEVLHEHPDPPSLAHTLKKAAGRYYGTVGRQWLECIVKERANLKERIAEGMRRFIEEMVPKGAVGQVERVARRFALAGVAGELAMRYCLTGWPHGEASQAARSCFQTWLDAFGPGNREERAILAQARGFFEQHGSSRFERIDTDTDQRIPNRAGFYDMLDDGGREFLVLPEVFRQEICRGVDEKQAKAALRDAGMLIPAKDNRSTQVHRLPGLSKATRVYVFHYIGRDR